jgi:hypothetical protein
MGLEGANANREGTIALSNGLEDLLAKLERVEVQVLDLNGGNVKCPLCGERHLDRPKGAGKVDTSRDVFRTPEDVLSLDSSTTLDLAVGAAAGASNNVTNGTDAKRVRLLQEQAHLWLAISQALGEREWQRDRPKVQADKDRYGKSSDTDQTEQVDPPNQTDAIFNGSIPREG